MELSIIGAVIVGFACTPATGSVNSDKLIALALAKSEISQIRCFSR